ncbi:MAG: quinolinate synthase NadA [Lachnospirales bacterium]
MSLERIREIKNILGDDLLILAHHYQRDEIVEVADFVGDSLKLAQFAENNKKSKYVVFCGVYFMSETADILTEDNQIVLQPDMSAGCPMANMATKEEAEKAWEIITKEFGESIVPITYINSTADVKAFCGIHQGTTVTSGNAGKIVKWGLGFRDKILFLPDQNLGRNTAYDLGIALENMAEYDPKEEKLTYNCNKEDVKIILWKGYCHVHHKITVDDVKLAREAKPDAKVIVHPECQFEIASIADGKGSTEYLINEVKNAESGTTWIVGTEANLVARVKEDNPDKNVFILKTSSVCTNMNKTTVENLTETLEDILNNDFKKRVVVDKETAENAKLALNTMLSLS